MKNFVKILFVSLVLCASTAMADEPVAAEPAAPSAEAALQQELAVRDSAMQVQGNACNMEKDSLRAAIEMEKAKSDNWEKSYNTIKKDNETCAQMLSTSIGVKEKEEEDRRSAAMATSSSFLGGFGVGMLVMWLIMK